VKNNNIDKNIAEHVIHALYLERRRYHVQHTNAMKLLTALLFCRKYNNDTDFLLCTNAVRMWMKQTNYSQEERDQP